MPKTIQGKIRRLEESITKGMNPALEKADRTKLLQDHEVALEKARAVLRNARLIVHHEKEAIRAMAPTAACLNT